MLLTIIVTHSKPSIGNLYNECAKAWDVIVLWDYPSELVNVNRDYRQYENKWFDFGKIREFLKKEQYLRDSYDTVVITNDTISPIEPMDRIFGFVKQSDKLWGGATDAYTSLPDLRDVDGLHVQSFFLFLKREAKTTYRQHMISMKLIEDKFRWVHAYEQGMSRLLQHAHWEPSVYLPIKTMMLAHGWHRIAWECDAVWYDRCTQDNWELNASFKYPKQYVDDWLPFIKNTCRQYQYKPYTVYSILPPTEIEQGGNDLFIYCTCEYDPSWINIEVTWWTYVHLKIDNKVSRPQLHNINENVYACIVPGYGREVGALRYLAGMLDMTQFDTITYLNDSVRLLDVLPTSRYDGVDIVYYTDSLNYIDNKYVYFWESYYYRVQNVKRRLEFLESIGISSEKMRAVKTYEMWMSKSLSRAAVHEAKNIPHHDIDDLTKAWDVCNQSYVNTRVVLKLTHHNNGHKRLHRGNIQIIADILYNS